MKNAIKYIEGEHDYTSFKSSGTSSKSSVRTIYKAEIIEDGEKNIHRTNWKWIFIQYGKDNSRNTCRSWTRKNRTGEIKNIIEKKERILAGKTLLHMDYV